MEPYRPAQLRIGDADLFEPSSPLLRVAIHYAVEQLFDLLPTLWTDGRLHPLFLSQTILQIVADLNRR